MQEIDRVRKDCEAGRATTAPLLAQLLKGGEDGTLTDAELLDNLIGFMIAGFETTSANLTRVLLQLAQHENVQKRHVIRASPSGELIVDIADSETKSWPL